MRYFVSAKKIMAVFVLVTTGVLGTAPDAHAQVKAHQKISDTEGGFTGTLKDNDRFGNSGVLLGDLDGDGVDDIAVGAYLDDYGNTQPGAVWVLFLNSDGTVKSHQKITENEGGFTGDLDVWDEFGISLESLGDLDGDSVGDLAVGACLDDDGGTNRGAVWILFLNMDGTVKSYQKISDTAGGFTGTLDDEDFFGQSIASLEDFDGDGVSDLAVGARLDDDGGYNRGAVWILYLNSDGTVKSHQKISDTEGGFTGTLADEDSFSSSMRSLGDYDGDGVVDLAVGAFGDNDGGANRGAVWILFLNSDGTVKSHQKISDTEGGFTGMLDDNDGFGGRIAYLGNLYCTGWGVLAVSAKNDDDGGPDRGAVWLLSLNTDGTVNASQKISSTQGGFTGNLDDGDAFGSPVALGDFDGDGTGDMAVGAVLDDDGGYNRGAVWILFLTGCIAQPTSLDFDTVMVGLSKEVSFNIKNQGCVPVTGNVSESCDHYSITAGGGPYSLAQGESLVVTIRFAPTAPGTHECVVSTGSADCGDVYCIGEGIPGGCDVQPMLLNFGAIAMDDSADLDFKIYNTGSGTLNGSVSESCQHYEIASGAGGYSLAPGDSHTVTVRFKPTLIGTWYCTIETGAVCSNVSCGGISYEPPPVCLIEPEALVFGNVDVGGFKIMTFDITNTGYGTLAGTMSESCTYFDIVSGGTYSLTHDQSQTVSIIFYPGTAGLHECTIETGNDACVDVSCVGYGGTGGPECAVGPDTLDFGTVIIGNSSDLDFFITNTGGDTLSGTVSEACDHYSITAGEGAYALAAGETIFVTVRFEPTLSGNQTCTIETGTILCGDVYCTGDGTDPPLCVMEPDTLDFGAVPVGAVSDLDFFITNAGGDTLSGTVSEACNYYSITAGGGAYALAAGETVFVTVRFEPTLSGSHTCTIETGTILCSDMYCTGTGVGIICVMEPDTLDFGTVLAGTFSDMDFFITNAGGDTLSGTMSESCDYYSITAGGGAYSIAAGETVFVTVRFEPTISGNHACTIETGTVLCGDVYCTGVGNICVVEPDTLDFGTVAVGDSLDMEFDIINVSEGIMSGTVSDTCVYFDVVAGGGSYGLAAGETLHVTVRFKPDAEESFNCWVETGVECANVYCTGAGDVETWYIKPDGSGDAPTIQAGIDSADAGDFVILASGTFSGAGNNSIYFHGKAVTVMSESGAEVTIIDCGGANGFLLWNGEGRSSVLYDLTITNAYKAVYCNPAYNTSPTLEHCLITSCYIGIEAGVDWEAETETASSLYSSPYIENCTFSGIDNAIRLNESASASVISCTITGCGGGVHLAGRANIVNCSFIANNTGVVCPINYGFGSIVNCEFSDHTNHAVSNSGSLGEITGCTFTNNGGGNRGGAIFIVQSFMGGGPDITDNVFIGNSAGDYGGAIYVGGSIYRIEIAHNLFYMNSSEFGGGAICMEYDNIADIYSNTFVENSSTANNPHDKGAGGIHLSGDAEVNIYNNIIAFSTEGLGGVVCENGASPILTCNDIYGNVGGDSICGIDGGNNFSADPLFCEPDSGNFQIRDDSPCAPANSPTGCGLIGADSVGCSSGTGVVEPEITIPSSFYLGPAVPNPFNPVTTIRFGVPEDHKVRITVHDVAGHLVATLVDDYFAAGEYSAQWNGRNSIGADVASGVYFARLVAGEYSSTRKMVLLK